MVGERRRHWGAAVALIGGGVATACTAQISRPSVSRVIASEVRAGVPTNIAACIANRVYATLPIADIRDIASRGGDHVSDVGRNQMTSAATACAAPVPDPSLTAEPSTTAAAPKGPVAAEISALLQQDGRAGPVADCAGGKLEGHLSDSDLRTYIATSGHTSGPATALIAQALDACGGTSPAPSGSQPTAP